MASRSVNRVILIGNLTRDPELKYTPQGTPVCSFGVATNRNWATTTGEIKEDVQFHRIVAWQKLAELCGKILTKGRKVYLEGRLTYRSFVGKDGVQRTMTEIILDDFVVFDDRRKAEDTISPSASPSGPMTDSVEKTAIDSLEEKAKEDKKDKVDNIDAGSEKIDPDDIPF